MYIHICSFSQSQPQNNNPNVGIHNHMCCWIKQKLPVQQLKLELYAHCCYCLLLLILLPVVNFYPWMYNQQQTSISSLNSILVSCLFNWDSYTCFVVFVKCIYGHISLLTSFKTKSWEHNGYIIPLSSSNNGIYLLPLHGDESG